MNFGHLLYSVIWYSLGVSFESMPAICHLRLITKSDQDAGTLNIKQEYPGKDHLSESGMRRRMMMMMMMIGSVVFPDCKAVLKTRVC